MSLLSQEWSSLSRATQQVFNCARVSLWALHITAAMRLMNSLSSLATFGTDAIMILLLRTAITSQRHLLRRFATKSNSMCHTTSIDFASWDPSYACGLSPCKSYSEISLITMTKISMKKVITVKILKWVNSTSIMPSHQNSIEIHPKSKPHNKEISKIHISPRSPQPSTTRQPWTKSTTRFKTKERSRSSHTSTTKISNAAQTSLKRTATRPHSPKSIKLTSSASFQAIATIVQISVASR